MRVGVVDSLKSIGDNFGRVCVIDSWHSLESIEHKPEPTGISFSENFSNLINHEEHIPRQSYCPPQ